jgi:hypothetical protein
MYRLPTFNLVADYWQNGDTTQPPSKQRFPCQLYFPKQVTFNNYNTNPVVYMSTVFLRMPRGTDLRWQPNQDPPPKVEVPSGSGKRYIVKQVEDCNCGFANEFRVAVLVPVAPWPAPIPPGPLPTAAQEEADLLECIEGIEDVMFGPPPGEHPE